MRDNRDRQETDRLSELLSGIKKPDIRAMEQAKLRWNSVAKPIGSLGILEEDIIKIAGMRQSSRDVSVEKSALAVFCADHDVVKEGVTQTGQEVTRIVAENLTKYDLSYNHVWCFRHRCISDRHRDEGGNSSGKGICSRHPFKQKDCLRQQKHRERGGHVRGGMCKCTVSRDQPCG